MSLASAVAALATRLATEFNTVRTEFRRHNQAPRTQTVSASTANIDVGAAGDLHVTVNTVTTTTITPTNGQNGRTCVVEVTAATGATRTVTIGGTPKKGEGVATAALAIPAGGTGRFVIRYSTLASLGYSLDSAYLVA